MLLSLLNNNNFYHFPNSLIPVRTLHFHRIPIPNNHFFLVCVHIPPIIMYNRFLIFHPFIMFLETHPPVTLSLVTKYHFFHILLIIIIFFIRLLLIPIYTAPLIKCSNICTILYYPFSGGTVSSGITSIVGTSGSYSTWIFSTVTTVS